MRTALTKLALTLALMALLVGVRILEHEAPIDRTSELPTPESILTRLDELGGKYQLNDLGQVTRLNLQPPPISNYLPISNDDLKILHELPHLKVLNLRGINHHKGYQFTNEGLRHVAALKKLVNLDLSVNHSITDEGIKYLTGCESLRQLNLHSTNTGPACYPHLVQVPRLDYLTVSKDPLNEETLPLFQKMSLILLKGVEVSEEDVRLFAELPTVKYLPLKRSIRDIDLKYLKHQLPTCTELGVVLTKGWGDTSEFKHLDGLESLEHLSFRDEFTTPPNRSPLDLSGFKTLSRLPNLKGLYLPSEDRFLAALARCPSVEILNLQQNDFLTEEGIELITKMPNLKKLSVPEELVNDHLLENISQVKTLEKLTLRRNYPVPYVERIVGLSRVSLPIRPDQFTLTGVKHLTELPRLKELDISDWGIDDEMLGMLGEITTLEVLRVGTTTVTDTGMMQLRRLWKLKSLYLYSFDVSRQVCYQLRNYMPDCTIDDMWCCGCMAITPGVNEPSSLW